MFALTCKMILLKLKVRVIKICLKLDLHSNFDEDTLYQNAIKMGVTLPSGCLTGKVFWEL